MLFLLACAASGLTVFLEDEEGKACPTLTRARLWAVAKTQEASAALPLPRVEALPLALNNPHLLPLWAEKAQQLGKLKEAGRFAMWYTVAYLLEAASRLEDGEAEDMTAAVLTAFTAPHLAPGWPAEALALSSSPEDVPGLSDFVPTVQSWQLLEGGRVRLEVEGGEGHEVSREECSFTALPHGGLLSVFVGTPDAATLRLLPEDTATVCRLFGIDPSGQGWRMN